YAQSPSRLPIIRRELFHLDHAMRQAEHMRIETDSRLVHLVIKQQHGYAVCRKSLLEIEQLAAITQRRLGHQTKLRERIKHDARRLESLRFIQQQFGDLVQL